MTVGEGGRIAGRAPDVNCPPAAECECRRTAVSGMALSAKSDLRLLAASSRRSGATSQGAVQKYCLGVTHDNNESFRAAMDAYKSFIKAVSSSSSPQARAHACLGLNAVAISAQCSGDLRSALAFHAEHAKAAPDVRNRALALCNAGLVHRLLGSLPDSDACFTQALAMAQDAEDGPMSVLAAGHVGINATLCAPEDAARIPPSLGPLARALHALPVAGLREAVSAEARQREQAAGGPRRRRVVAARAPRPVGAPPSEAEALSAVAPATRPPRALADAAVLPRGGLPVAAVPATVHAPLMLVSATGRALRAGAAPAALTITHRRQAESRAGKAAAQSALGDAAAAGALESKSATSPSPSPSLAADAPGGGDAAAVQSAARDRAEEAREAAEQAKAAEVDARLDTGEAALTEAAGMLTSVDDPSNGATILAGLGAVAAARGRFDEAERRFAAASMEAAHLDSAASSLFACFAAAAAAEGLHPDSLSRSANQSLRACRAAADEARVRESWRQERLARLAGKAPPKVSLDRILVVEARVPRP